jgi:hypothetical protein
MIKSDKKLKELSADLAVKNSQLVQDAIFALREYEPFEGAISLLAGLFDKTSDEGIRDTITDFFNDLKDPSASAEVIQEIRKPYNEDTLSMLISSCWQSGLDYSGFADDLVDIFLASGFIIALECLTVIEESAGNLTRTRKDQLISYIEKYPEKPEAEKEGLTRELISILNDTFDPETE